MYRGLLPKGLTEADLSSDEEEEEEAGDDQDTDREKLGEHGVISGTSNNTNNNSGTVDSSSHTSPTVQEHESILPGISQETWQKFKELQKKKNEIKETKDFRRRRRRNKKAGTSNKDSTTEEREHHTEPEKHWDELTQYFGVNDRFQPPACSKPPPQSGLEKSIDGAIAEGDIAKAEEMSDRLATRELGVKIAQAADCRNYVEQKQEEEASRAAQKRKNQITWGFEAKRRWETKSNMGYM